MFYGIAQNDAATSVPITHCLTKYKGLFLGNKENDLKDSRDPRCVLLQTYELISEFSQQLVYGFCRGDLVKKERNIFLTCLKLYQK